MALVKCSECGNQVSTEAAACPSCGAPRRPLRQGVSPWTIIGWIFLAFVLLLMYGCFQAFKPGGPLDPNREPRSASAYTAPEPAAPAPSSYLLHMNGFTCKNTPGGMAVGEGEVLNSGAETIPYVEIKIAFLAKDGSTIGYGSGYADSKPLRPGETSTFRALGPTTDFDHCAIEQANTIHGNPVNFN